MCVRTHIYSMSAIVKGNGLDNYLTLFDLIGIFAHRRYYVVEAELAALGLNHTEARILAILDQEGDLAQDSLSAFLPVDRSNAGRALKRLEEDSLVNRRKIDRDKRTFLVGITDAGRRAAADIQSVRKAAAKKLFAGMKAKDAKAAAELLKTALTAEEYAERASVTGTGRSYKQARRQRPSTRKAGA